jgi:hypothetical protein
MRKISGADFSIPCDDCMGESVHYNFYNGISAAITYSIGFFSLSQEHSFKILHRIF